MPRPCEDKPLPKPSMPSLLPVTMPPVSQHDKQEKIWRIQPSNESHGSSADAQVPHVQERITNRSGATANKISSGSIDGSSSHNSIRSSPKIVDDELIGDQDEETRHEEILPHAILVGNQSSSQQQNNTAVGGGIVAVATKARWRDALKNKNFLFGLLLLLLGVVGGIIGGVVYAVTSGNDDGGSNSMQTGTVTPTTLFPTVTPITNAPMTLILQQLGQDIINADDEPISTGPRGELYFGWSVDLSFDGMRLVASAPYHQRVQVYDFDSENLVWVPSGQVKEDSGLVDHITLSGNGKVLAVGVPSNSQVHSNGGKVQVYMEDSLGSWVTMGQPIFGQGTDDLIGGFTDDDDLYNDNDIRPSLSLDSYDSSTIALSENGNILAIGSPQGNYVLTLSFDAAMSQWVKLGSNDLMGEAEGDKFGNSVELSADGFTLVVGAPKNVGSRRRTFGIRPGHTRIYRFEVDGDSWKQLGDDIDGDPYFLGRKYGEEAGSVVSISADGSRIAVGANFQHASEDIDSLGENDGSVRVYRYDEATDSWKQVGNTINIFQFGLSGLGYKESAEVRAGRHESFKFPVVSRLSGDGTRLAISVLAESLGGAFSSRGVVRLYGLAGDNWNQLGPPVEGASDFDNTGRSISLSYDGSKLAVGAPQHNAEGPDDGLVRVFGLQGVVPTPVPTCQPSSVSPTGTAGPSVALTIVLHLDFDSEYLGWSLQCDNLLIKNIMEGTYNSSEFADANVTETFLVPDQTVCILSISNDWAIRSCKVFYGSDALNSSSLILDSDDFEDDIAFYVAPNTVSLVVSVKLDAYPFETGLELRCQGFSFLDIRLGELLYADEFETKEWIVMGIKEGASCELAIVDTFGDGICCDSGEGFYQISYGDVDGPRLAAGGQFDSKETIKFTATAHGDTIATTPSFAPTFVPTNTA